jgi:hypothetical protein
MKEWHLRANDIITSEAETLAHSIMARHFEVRPDLAEKYGERQREIYLRDTKHNLEALAASVLLLAPETFADYMAWVKSLLEARNIPTAGLPLHVECMAHVLQEALPEEVWEKTREYVEAGLPSLK